MAASKNTSSLCLLCKIHPKTEQKASRVLQLLGETYPYYRTEKSQCTTWCYLIPSKRKGAIGARDDNPPIVAGVELYTHKDALSTQLADEQYFQRYHRIAKEEDLYSKPEDLVAWYPAAGFITRGSEIVEHEDGMIVILAEVSCKDEASRDEALHILRDLSSWVLSNEPDTLTYSIMTRPKASNELFVFERYRSQDSMLRHLGSEKIKNDLAQFTRFASQSLIQEWVEIDGSFVSPVSNRGNTSGTKL